MSALVHAIERRQETIDHLDGTIEYLGAETAPVDATKLAAMVKLLRDSGTLMVPTMPLWETIIGSADLAPMLAYPELRYMPRAEVERWKTGYERRLADPKFSRRPRPANRRQPQDRAQSLVDGGVTILFGTDAPQQFSVPGFSVVREMQANVDAGLTPYQVLQSATKKRRRLSESQRHVRPRRPGHRADLLLLDANPLQTIGHIEKRAGVMLRGRWLPESELQAGLAQIAAAQAAPG
jgi:hypothetical protein